MDESAIVGPCSGARGDVPSPTSPSNAVPSARSGASARAAALTARARALGAAQAEVHSLTMTEVDALAHAAANFFDTLPLPEFSGTLLPASARGARRMRHKVLHQAMVADENGATLRALLLGRDAQLRMFSARSSVARDFMSAIEPGQGFMAGINRDVAEWTPRMRIAEFRPADVLDRLSAALDEVEQRLAIAERRIAAQRTALADGNFDLIRDSLGTSTVARAGIAPEAVRPASMRLTPGLGMRAIRPPSPPPAIAPMPALAQLPTGDMRPAMAVATEATTVAGASPIAAPASTGGESATSSAAPASRPEPTVIVGQPVAPTAPSAAGGAATGETPATGAVKALPWLTRAVRAALRTPPPVPSIADAPASQPAPDAHRESGSGTR